MCPSVCGEMHFHSFLIQGELWKHQKMNIGSEREARQGFARRVTWENYSNGINPLSQTSRKLCVPKSVSLCLSFTYGSVLLIVPWLRKMSWQPSMDTTGTYFWRSADVGKIFDFVWPWTSLFGSSGMRWPNQAIFECFYNAFDAFWRLFWACVEGSPIDRGWTNQLAWSSERRNFDPKCPSR